MNFQETADKIEADIKSGLYTESTITAAMLQAPYGRFFGMTMVKEIESRGLIVLADEKASKSSGYTVWNIVREDAKTEAEEVSATIQDVEWPKNAEICKASGSKVECSGRLFLTHTHTFSDGSQLVLDNGILSRDHA